MRSLRIGQIMALFIALSGGHAGSAGAATGGLAAGETEQTGARRLTEAAYDEAVACGHAGAHCAVEPYLICAAANARFHAYIATPFQRVASSVYEAAGKGSEIKPMSPGEANGWGVGVYVLPGGNPRFADPIVNVAVLREGKRIEPLTTTIAPAMYRGAASPPLTKGFFAFPPGTFAPGAPVTVVLTGTAGSADCVLDRARLEAMR
jgi:hypothetical protein